MNVDLDGGVLVPVVTPFRRGDVDWDSLRKAARWFAACGADALWLNGTTSEFHALREDEMVEVVRVVAETVPEDCPVIAHVGAPATRLALRLAGPCAEAGADAVSAVPPYYLPYGDDEVLGYFRAIRGEAGVPLLAYNIPALTKLAVSKEMILLLTAEGTITGVKDTQWTVPEVSELTGAAAREGMRVPVFVGDATTLADAVRAGAAGTVTAISNAVPRHCMRLFAAARRGDHAHAAALQRDLTAAVAATVVSTRPPGTPRMGAVKYLLAELGVIDDPETAAPYRPLSAAERAELSARALPLVRRLEDEAKHDQQTTGKTIALRPRELPSMTSYKSRKLTRRLAAGTGAVLCLGFAAACGSSGTGTTTQAGASFGVNAKGVVNFWARSSTSAVSVAMVRQFNASHPGLKVDLHLMAESSMPTELATAIRAGSQPDLVGLDDVYVPPFAREGTLMNLTKLIGALPYESALSQGHLQLGEYSGNEYAAPYLADLSVLWYNKTLFQRAGVNPDQAPNSYASILADAQKVNKLGHGISGFSFAGDCPGCLAFTMLPEIWPAAPHLIQGPFGSQKAAITGNAPLASLLTMYHEIWSQHLAPAADQTQAGLTWGADFQSGKIGILPGGYDVGAKFTTAADRAEFADAPLPGPDGGYSTFDGGDDFILPNGAKNSSGAWEFVTWVLAQNQQLEFPLLGYTPVRTDLLTASYRAKYPYDAVALKALAHGSVESTLAYDDVFNDPGSPWDQMFNTAVYDGKVSAAIQAGQGGITSALASVSG